MSKIKTFSQAQKYLFDYIPQQPPRMFPGYLGLKRTKCLLKLLDNPQDKLKVIHIAGTSGKGSTAYLTSLLLQSQGFRVGLQVSPHILDIRERVQINNQLISQDRFCFYLNQLAPFIEQMKSTKFGSPTYFEILTVFGFYLFWQEKVDYAVIETGLGGLYDATNSINSTNKLVILTKIGLDHRSILGRSIKEITLQKAEIIKPKNTAISIDQTLSSRKVIAAMVTTRQAKLVFIKTGINFQNVRLTLDKTIFDFNFGSININNLKLGMIGFHQAENCSLALTALVLLGIRDHFKFDMDQAKIALKKADFIGRLQIIKKNDCTFIIDGAHNPQKMRALVNTLTVLLPRQKFNFLIAFKKGKDYHSMLKIITPLAKKIFITDFSVTTDLINYQAEKPSGIGNLLERLDFKNYQCIPDPQVALKKACADTSGYLVVTGSLYLISEIYPLLKTS